jgi:hypothetical protein
MCSQLFNELPPKRDYPDYYLIITQPIVRLCRLLDVAKRS